jgi:gas vesicle protein GvpG
MGLLAKVLFFPVMGPVAGIQWTLRKVAQVVDEELTDDTPIKQELMELQMQLELGDIDDEEYVRREAEIMKRLRDVRAWRERFGKSVSGGPVRVAGGEEGEEGEESGEAEES